jgi:hypothetical protein
VILLQTVGDKEEKKTSIQRNAQLRRFLTLSGKTVSRASQLLLCKRCVAANAVRLGSLGGLISLSLGSAIGNH